MKKSRLLKIEKFLILFAIVLVIIIAVCLLLLAKRKKQDVVKETVEASEEETEYNWEEGLSDSTLWLPSGCQIYNQIPEFSMTDRNGNSVSVRDYAGKPLVVVYWASWCDDCREQMSVMKDYMNLAENYGDINFVFLNRTDGEKESRESAESYFSQLEMGGELCFDEDLSAFDTLGIHNTPTTFFIDAQGTLEAWSAVQITRQSEFQALLEKMLYGGSYATAEFIQKVLMDETGGIRSRYDAENQESVAETLSESEGCMLEYAAETGDKELFYKLWDYIQKELPEEGLAAWRTDESGPSSVNALIDDLRIYAALEKAQDKWGNLENNLNDYRDRLKQYGLNRKKYIDFYDSSNAGKADRITLCYIDLAVMNDLSNADSSFKKPLKNATEILENGKISDDFPLYYSYYDYGRKKYAKDDLNTTEAMVTLLHLAEAGQLEPGTLNWLKKEIASGGLKARYTVDGEVVEGYEYESTAAYAIAAQIGIEENDVILTDMSVRKMEKMRIDDTSVEYNGAFGMEDGTGITAFDEIMPLVTYQKLEEKNKKM